MILGSGPIGLDAALTRLDAGYRLAKQSRGPVQASGKPAGRPTGFFSVSETVPSTGPVTVYWRPGCPFCSRLRADLHRTGIPLNEVNIWEDTSAAATVRSLAGGNETVPTVLVGKHAMVNPPAAKVLDALRNAAPEMVTDRAHRAVAASTALRALQWTIIAGLIVAGFVIEAQGAGAWSWALDGAAVAVYLLFRLLRR